jgi:hypothetical protein
MKIVPFAVSLGLAAVVANAHAAAPAPVATWGFNNTLAANEAGAPALTAIDPLGASGFVMDTVFGESRWVWRFDGNRTPSEQAGLSVDTSGLLDGDNAYSVDIVFQFESNDSTWEHVLGVSNRQSDNALYVEPGNHLQVWPTGGGPTAFTFGEYHRVTMTNRGDGTVTAYMDGIFQFDLTTTSMDFSAYAAANPSRLIHFFADNLTGGGQSEFADGRVALIRLYDIELSGGEVGELPPLPAVPEPGPLAMMLAGGALVAAVSRRRRKQAA